MTSGNIGEHRLPKHNMSAAWISLDGNASSVARAIAKIDVPGHLDDLKVLVRNTEILLLAEINAGRQFAPDQMAFDNLVSDVRGRWGLGQGQFPTHRYDPVALYKAHPGWVNVRKSR